MPPAVNRLVWKVNTSLSHRRLEGIGDAELLTRFVAIRDEAALVAIIERHGPMMLGMCQRVLGNHHDAADALQASFLVLARRAGTILKPDSLGSWLAGVAYRIAKKMKSTAMSRRRHEQQAAQPEAGLPPDPSWCELLAALDEEVERLPDKQRQPLILCFFEGHSQEEAAAQLGWPRGTLKKRLERARKILRQRLSNRGLTLGVAPLATLGAARLLASPLAPGMASSLARAAGLFAANQCLPNDLIHPAIRSLADGALKTMSHAKFLKSALAMVGVLILSLSGGAAWWSAHARSAEHDEKQAQAGQEPKLSRDSSSAPDDKAGSHELPRGDLLPNGARARIGSGRFLHANQLYMFRFSPDSKKLVSTGSDGIVRVWDAATGTEIRQINPHAEGLANPVIAVAEFAPDSKTIAVTVVGKGLLLYDIETGKLIRELEQAVIQGNTTHICFSPDGKRLVTLNPPNILNRAIQLFDIESGKEIRKFEGHESFTNAAVFSADGKHLVTASEDETIRLWNVASGKQEKAIEGHRAGVNAVAISPDGRYLASAGADSSLRIWNAANGELLHSYTGLPIGGVLHFSPDGKALTASLNDGVYKWDVASGKSLRKPKEPNKLMSAQYVMSPDEKYLARYTSYFGSGHLAILDGATERELETVPKVAVCPI